jgi:hypothetical protein
MAVTLTIIEMVDGPQISVMHECFTLMSFYVSLRSVFRIVMSVMISTYKDVGSSLPPFVCRRAHVLFALFVIICT